MIVAMVTADCDNTSIIILHGGALYVLLTVYFKSMSLDFGRKLKNGEFIHIFLWLRRLQLN